MERGFNFAEGQFYHVYNRGVDKRKIFFTENDKRHFQNLLALANQKGGKRIRWERVTEKHKKGKARIPLSELVGKGSPCPLVDIVAYALMDNHFHLLLREREPGGITKFMSKLSTSFSMYMNKKYDRTGPLMCKPFRAKHVDGDEYLRWLIQYIHLNPVDQIDPDWEKNGVKSPKKTMMFLNEYNYSSYCDYIKDTERAEGIILNKELIPVDVIDIDAVKEIISYGQGESLPI